MRFVTNNVVFDIVSAADNVAALYYTAAPDFQNSAAGTLNLKLAI